MVGRSGGITARTLDWLGLLVAASVWALCSAAVTAICVKFHQARSRRTTRARGCRLGAQREGSQDHLEKSHRRPLVRRLPGRRDAEEGRARR